MKKTTTVNAPATATPVTPATATPVTPVTPAPVDIEKSRAVATLSPADIDKLRIKQTTPYNADMRKELITAFETAGYKLNAPKQACPYGFTDVTKNGVKIPVSIWAKLGLLRVCIAQRLQDKITPVIDINLKSRVCSKYSKDLGKNIECPTELCLTEIETIKVLNALTTPAPAEKAPEKAPAEKPEKAPEKAKRGKAEKAPAEKAKAEKAPAPAEKQ